MISIQENVLALVYRRKRVTSDVVRHILELTAKEGQL